MFLIVDLLITSQVKKVETLKETRSFYIWKLKDKGLTEEQRNEFSKALRIIEKIIKEKEDCRERGKAVFLNKKGY